MSVKYFPSAVQILTAGSDRKIAYWEVLDGSIVRELEGSPSGTINSLAISPDGSLFVSGGNDQIVKLWTYQEGVTTHIGLGHAAVVTDTKFSADGKYIVTCDAAGCVFVWECPQETSEAKKADEKQIEESNIPLQIGSADKEENIIDLPSVRSHTTQAAGGESNRSSSVEECRCKCSPKSESDDGKRISARSSDSKKSTKSQHSTTNKIKEQNGNEENNKNIKAALPDEEKVTARSTGSQKSVKSQSAMKK